MGSAITVRQMRRSYPMPVSTTPVAKPTPSTRLQMLLVMMRQQRQTYGGKLAG